MPCSDMFRPERRELVASKAGDNVQLGKLAIPLCRLQRDLDVVERLPHVLLDRRLGRVSYAGVGIS